MWSSVLVSSFMLMAVSPAMVHAAAQASSTQSAPAVATSFSVNLGMQLVNQPIIPIQDPVLSLLLNDVVPDHLNVSCRSCVSQGSISVVAGGYNSSDSAMDIAEDFNDNGYIQATAHGVSGNFQTEINLLPGFKVASLRIPIFKIPIGSIKFGRAAALDLNFNIYVPLSITLDSEVDIYPSVKIEIPDGATVFLDFGDLSNSYATGFNQSKVTPSYNVDQPSLSFTFLQGIEMVVELAAHNNASDSSVDVSGKLEASLELPLFNETITAMNHVNSSCQTPQGSDKVYEEAIRVDYAAGLDFTLKGEIDVSRGSVPLFKWDSPPLGNFNRSVPLGEQCFAWDATNHKYNQVNSGAALTTSPTRACMMGLVAFVAAIVVL